MTELLDLDAPAICVCCTDEGQLGVLYTRDELLTLFVNQV